MPTYDYRCEECDRVFEMTHGIDDSLECCPACGGRVRRLFHPVGIIFKGSGFYKTDYRSPSGNGGDKPSPERIEKELEKAGDAAPAKKEKTESKPTAGD